MKAPVTGLAHVATVSFLASRAAPSAQFWLALGGGLALARAAYERGARTGYGASLAAMLQTVAVMGPARINAPLTQAMTAPMMGRLQARGAPAWLEFLACLVLRLVHYAVLLAAFIFIVLGGLDAFTGSYETLTSWVGFIPQGPQAALAVAAIGNLCWAIFFSVVQVTVYRRALGRWPEDAAAADAPAAAIAPVARAGRFDPRAVVLAALLASALLLVSTSWPLLLGVAAWLVPAWLLSRPDTSAVPLGLALAAMLGFAALFGGLLGGVGLELTLRRTLRAVLLVAVATWMRAAAGHGRAARDLPARPWPAAVGAQRARGGPAARGARRRAAADRGRPRGGEALRGDRAAAGAGRRRRDRVGGERVGGLPRRVRSRGCGPARAGARPAARGGDAAAGAGARGDLSGRLRLGRRSRRRVGRWRTAAG